MIGMIFSITCLLLTIFVYCLFPSLRNVPGKIMINLAISLILAQLLFLINSKFAMFKIVCKVLAIIQHYCWLAAFCWMNAFAIDVSKTFINMKKNISVIGQLPNAFWKYFLYGWGIPLVFIIGCVVADQNSELSFTYGWNSPMASKVCWIKPGMSVLYSIGVPLAVVLMANITCFTAALVVFLRMKKGTDMVVGSHNKMTDNSTVLVSLKLSTVMGFTWLLGFLANIDVLWPLWYVFILCNTLQGVTIFLAFVLTKKVHNLFVGVWGRYESKSESRSTSSTGQRRSSSLHDNPVYQITELE